MQKDIKQVMEDAKIVARVREHFDLCKSYYARAHKRMKFLDAIDKGDLWKALDAKFPKYQITPDTNHVSYIKNNILSSIYTVAKGASLLPTSEKDYDLIINLNVVLETVWELCDVGYFQFQAGERAALLNIGITQIGWDNDLTAGNADSFYKGNIALKNIDPIKFMRDPFATDLETSGYCMIYDNYHKSVFTDNPKYKEGFKKFVEKQNGSTIDIPDSTDRIKNNNQKDYYTLITYWEKDDNNKVNEYHVINGEYMLYNKPDIQPSEFPFAILHCNLPANNLIGTSECSKVLANSVARNIMNSIALTSEYKNQNPPKFVDIRSKLNLQAFEKYGDEANKTFVVSNNAKEAVHYHQFPQVSNMITTLGIGLEKDIQLVTGVDGRYTGRDTGSVITTGGVEDMLNRVTLIDTPKIILYERYCKRLSKLIISNLINFSQKRKYFRQKQNSTKWETIEVSFPDISNDTFFNYNINISSELPKNKQRIAAMANMLMEKQMQYNRDGGGGVELITTEEWLSMVDLPNKEYMLERMGVQRTSDAVEETAQVLFEYSDLVSQGLDPNEAILATASSLKNKRAGNMATPNIPGAVAENGLPLENM